MTTVIMVTWEYPPHLVGGLARHVHALSRELAAQGHDVHVLTRSGPGLPAEAMEDGVHVVRVAPYFQEPSDFRLWVCHLNYALMEAGARLAGQVTGPAVVHAHDWLVAYAARGIKSLFHMPLVATIHATEHGRHNGIHDQGQKYINDVEWWLTYEAWRVVVCSQAMRGEVQWLFGLNDDKVQVIPNGIDLKAAVNGPFPPRQQFAAPGEKLIFHIGRLVPEKGVAVLLEAMPHVLKRHHARLVVAGTGPFGDELRRRAHQLGLGDRVSFVGWVDDATAHALYSYADVAVVPSTYEPFGIVALEAMAAGAPLVASDVGGLSEIVRHGENGLKALPGHAISLAEQIERLLTDRALSRRLAGAALHEVQTKYTWAGIARTTAELYDQIITECSQTEWGTLRFAQPLPPRVESLGLHEPDSRSDGTVEGASGSWPGRYTM
ncbi:MAG: glycosyl transferase family 1 [Symbiobacteriaceae bacterium]|nr:glycosyl transferase family 1 [Symbiobacteriaceae bacterium]